MGWLIQSGRISLFSIEASQAEAQEVAPKPEQKIEAPQETSRLVPESKLRLEFQQYSEQVLRQLPKVQELQALSRSEIHGTPALLQEAAVQLGHIASWLEEDASLKPQALGFYQACSLGEDFATPVRALCLNHALRLFAELHQNLWNYDQQKIPDRVLSLAKRL